MPGVSLAPLGTMRELRVLDLGNSYTHTIENSEEPVPGTRGIDTEGIAHLAKLTQLRELNFHRYQVSLAEIETLVAGLPQLMEFNSDLDEGDGDRFKKRFPHCEFHSCW